jgi:hypothetical protein
MNSGRIPVQRAILYDSDAREIGGYESWLKADRITAIKIKCTTPRTMRATKIDKILESFQEKGIDTGPMIPYIDFIKENGDDEDTYDFMSGIQEHHIRPVTNNSNRTVANNSNNSNIPPIDLTTWVNNELKQIMEGTTPMTANFYEDRSKPLSDRCVFFSWNRVLTVFKGHVQYGEIVERIRLKGLDETTILNSMLIYLFGGEARLAMIRNMFDMLAGNGVQICIITGDAECPKEFVELLMGEHHTPITICSMGELKGSLLGHLSYNGETDHFKPICNPIQNIFRNVFGSWGYTIEAGAAALLAGGLIAAVVRRRGGGPKHADETQTWLESYIPKAMDLVKEMEGTLIKIEGDMESREVTALICTESACYTRRLEGEIGVRFYKGGRRHKKTKRSHKKRATKRRYRS